MAFTHWNGQPHMIKVDFKKVPYKGLAIVEGFPNKKSGTYPLWGSLEIKESTKEDGLLMITGIAYTSYEEITPLIVVGYKTNPVSKEQVLRQTLYVPIYDVEEYRKVLGIGEDIPKLDYQTAVHDKIKGMLTRAGTAVG